LGKKCPGVSFTVLVLFSTYLLAKQTITLATTTSVYDSGLLDTLVPIFEKKHNCQVKIIAVGSGQAIRLGRNGDADILLVHDPELEKKFVADGFGIKRYPVASNDFVIVGPKNDSARVKKSSGVVRAFQLIARSSSSFVSRGDNSGTHQKELAIWEKAKILPATLNSGWYIESGSGMEQTLRIANEKNAYCLTDRATWLAHHFELKSLEILFTGDQLLLNFYSVIPVSPDKYPHLNYQLAKKFVDFITGQEGQKIIANFGRNQYGQALFHPVSNFSK